MEGIENNLPSCEAKQQYKANYRLADTQNKSLAQRNFQRKIIIDIVKVLKTPLFV